MYTVDSFTEHGIYMLMSLVQQKLESGELTKSKAVMRVAELIKRGLNEETYPDDWFNINIFDLKAYFDDPDNLEDHVTIIGRENPIIFFEEVASGILEKLIQRGSLRV